MESIECIIGFFQLLRHDVRCVRREKHANMLAVHRLLQNILTKQILREIFVGAVRHELGQIHFVSVDELHGVVAMVEGLSLRTFTVIKEIRKKAKNAFRFHRSFFVVLSSAD